MNKYVACLLPALLLAASCQSKQEKEPVYVPKSLHLEARIDRSEPVQIIDVEKALQNPEALKLSQIASEIEYYTVGDARIQGRLIALIGPIVPRRGRFVGLPVEGPAHHACPRQAVWREQSGGRRGLLF